MMLVFSNATFLTFSELCLGIDTPEKLIQLSYVCRQFRSTSNSQSILLVPIQGYPLKPFSFVCIDALKLTLQIDQTTTTDYFPSYCHNMRAERCCLSFSLTLPTPVRYNIAGYKIVKQIFMTEMHQNVLFFLVGLSLFNLLSKLQLLCRIW